MAVPSGTISALQCDVFRLLGVSVALLAVACGPSDEASPPQGAAGESSNEGGSADRSVSLGTPGGADGLSFVPLSSGAELRLQTFGQGGTHVLIAVRARGFGNRAFVSATLTAMATGIAVSEPAPARPQLLYCGPTGGDDCDLVPYLVHTSGLAPTNEEKDGLRVLLAAQVMDESGERAEGACEVVLSAADL